MFSTCAFCKQYLILSSPHMARLILATTLVIGIQVHMFDAKQPSVVKVPSAEALLAEHNI